MRSRLFTRSASISLALAAALFAAGSFEGLALIRRTSRAGAGGLAPVGVIDDERVYLFQARMLARGHLSEPSPPLPEFFEAMHTLVVPRFAGKYLPGHPLLLAPFAALGRPWLAPALLLGLYAAALFFAARAGGLSRLAALICGALPLCTGEIVSLFLTYLSWTSALAVTALALGCGLRWARGEGRGWLLGASSLAGFAFWIRPYTGAALILTVGSIALARALRAGSRGERLRIGLALALPLILWGSLTAIVCREVTGHFAELPWSLYARQYMPGDGPGFGEVQAAPAEREAPAHLRRFIEMTHALRDSYTLRRAAGRLPARLRELNNLLPSPARMPITPGLLWMLALLGLALAWRTLWPALAFALLFFALQLTFYAPTFFYLTELAVPLALGLAALLERAAHAIASLQLPALRIGAVALASLPAMFLGVAAWVQLESFAAYRQGDSSVLRAERALLPAAAAHGLVFLRYAPGASLPELNYNDPDIYTEPLIRALDLGARDAELLRAFPDRAAFLYDVATGALSPLAANLR